MKITSLGSLSKKADTLGKQLSVLLCSLEPKEEVVKKTDGIIKE